MNPLTLLKLRVIKIINNRNEGSLNLDCFIAFLDSLCSSPMLVVVKNEMNVGI